MTLRRTPDDAPAASPPPSGPVPSGGPDAAGSFGPEARRAETTPAENTLAGAAPLHAGGASAAPPPPRPAEESASGRHRPPAKRRSFLVELPVLIVLALLLALVVKTFLVQAFYIPSGSMENTLKIGDRVIVDKVSYRFRDIHRGDIVVFNGLDSFDPEVSTPDTSNPVSRVLRSIGRAIGVAPPGERDYIKRVIGVPGDVVACCDSRGRVTVNGVGLTEPYVYDNTPLSTRRFDAVKVPPGKLWVMGDHRGDSSDSRVHGVVPSNKVVGRAFVVVWPLSHIHLLTTPGTFTGSSLRHASPPPVTPSPSGGGLILALPGMVGLGATRRRHRPSSRLRMRS